MILKFYKSDQLPVLFSLPVIAILFWVPSFLNPVGVEFSYSSPAFQWLNGSLSPFVSQVLALIVILFSALIINGVINNNEVFSRNTFLPALLYVVSMSAIKEYQVLSPVVISNLFWILAFRRLFNIYRQTPCKREVFDATVFILLGALFYFPSIIMVLAVWGALKTLRPFVWREWLIPLFATLLFTIYVLSVLFWNGDVSSLGNYFNVLKGEYSFIELNVSWIYYVVFAIVFILINFSAFQLSKQLKGSSLRFRKIISFFIIVIILTILLLLLVKYFSGENIYTLVSAAPLSLLLTFYFYYAKKEWLSQLFFYSVFILLLVNIYM